MAFGDLCFETYDTMCNIFNEPFAAVLKPFDAVLGGPDGLGGIGGLTIAVIWGIIVGVLWLKTGNLMLVSIVGIVIATSVTGIYPEAVGIGYLLIGVSLGIVIFQLIRHKIQTFA